MNYSESIDKALSAHGLWKQRLLAAITNGSCEFSVAQVQVDNRCEFGKWFYSLPQDFRNSEQGVLIQRLHAEFHAEAARVLGLALAGRKNDATQALVLGSYYTKISGQLSMALTEWKHVVGTT